MDPITNVESSLYTAVFTSAEGYTAANSTAAASALPSSPTARSTSTPTPVAHAGLGPAAKIGIGLGAPLCACGLAGLALLLYRHRKHKERSRKRQMGNRASPEAAALTAGGKKRAEGSEGGQSFGRAPPVYSVEMQG